MFKIMLTGVLTGQGYMYILQNTKVLAEVGMDAVGKKFKIETWGKRSKGLGKVKFKPACFKKRIFFMFAGGKNIFSEWGNDRTAQITYI